MSFIFFILENEFLILKMNVDDFLILKNHFLTLENEFLILKIYPFYNIRSSFSYIRKKFLILKFIFQYYKISIEIKINWNVQKIFSIIIFNIRK